MQFRHVLFTFSPFLLLMIVGCATDRDAQIQQQTQGIRRGAFLLSATNAEPGSTYDLGIYVVTRGDTVGKIARQFQISFRDFLAINPGFDSTRLRIGQSVRIYERRRE